MWRSMSLPCFGPKKKSVESAKASHECSDDETCSNASSDEGLECPICWESFNIVENVPYVLWCGHTLCKNWEILNSLTKNSSFSGWLRAEMVILDRMKSPSLICRDHPQIWTPGCASTAGNHASNGMNWRMHRLGRPSSSNNHSRYNDSVTSERL